MSVELKKQKLKIFKTCFVKKNILSYRLRLLLAILIFVIFAFGFEKISLTMIILSRLYKGMSIGELFFRKIDYLYSQFIFKL